MNNSETTETIKKEAKVGKRERGLRHMTGLQDDAMSHAHVPVVAQDVLAVKRRTTW
jgi:hypothetical protein